MKVKEFIQMVKEGEFWSLGAVDNSDLGEGFEQIESGNNLDEHRWYSTAEDIYIRRWICWSMGIISNVF